MNAFSWLVLACVAICAALAVRAMRRAQRRGGCGACAGGLRCMVRAGCGACAAAAPPARTHAPGRVKKQNKRGKKAPCALCTRGCFLGKNNPSCSFFHIK